MRIAVNGAIIGKKPTGLGVYATNVVKELATCCTEMIVYTSVPVDGVPVVRRIPPLVRPEVRLKGHACRLLWTQSVLPWHIMIDRPDVLFNPLPEGPLLGKIPMVTVTHDLIPLRYPDDHPRQQYYFRYLVPAVLHRSRRIIADSTATKEDIQSFYGIDGERIAVVPAGYDRTIFVPEGDRWSLSAIPTSMDGHYQLNGYILYVGNLFPHKNLARLIRAFRSFWHEFRIALVIAGDRDPRFISFLESEIGSAPVFIMNYVSASILPALYRGAELFVLPSLYEGFGLTPLEAMACGTPVVLSRTPPLTELAGDAALYFDPMDEVSIAEALRMVLADSALRSSLREKALRRAQLFSWERTARLVFNELSAAANVE